MIPIRIIRRRIRSIRSTAKITKAMEMIAASKMRQAQLRVHCSTALFREDARGTG